MKPANGPLSLSGPPGMHMDCTVDDGGMQTPYGYLTWFAAPPPGVFIRQVPATPEFAIKFPDTETRYEALYMGDLYTGPAKRP